MYAEPADIDRGILVDTLRTTWGIAVDALEYQPVGFGSHHYSTRSDDGDRWFVTVDDLAAKPWMAADPDGVFDGLERAFRTALTLRSAGLEFVHAPTVRGAGRLLARVGSRYAMSVFSFIDGRAGEFEESFTASERLVLFAALGRLHGSAVDVPDELPRRDPLEIVLRDRLFDSLEELGSSWTGGPFSEPVRELLSGASASVRERFAAYDGLADVVRGSDVQWVVTHGEPHPGNVIWTDDDAFVLVDWDTVAVAPPERDLWDLEPLSDDERRAYTSSGGRAEVRPEALELYRLRWSLDEIALYVDLFRSEHLEDRNTRTAWTGLQRYVSGGT